MFRKDSKLISSYEKSKSQLVSVQKDLLTKASKMLKKGGKLIYSTCTFNKRENELNIIEFLKENSDFEIINIEKNFNFTSHLEIRLTHGNAIASDLGSTNGTFVEGHRIDAATLLDGNTLTVGRTRIMFWDGTQGSEAHG